MTNDGSSSLDISDQEQNGTIDFVKCTEYIIKCYEKHSFQLEINLLSNKKCDV